MLQVNGRGNNDGTNDNFSRDLIVTTASPRHDVFSMLLQTNGEGNNDGTNDNFSWNSDCIAYSAWPNLMLRFNVAGQRPATMTAPTTTSAGTAAMTITWRPHTNHADLWCCRPTTRATMTAEPTALVKTVRSCLSGQNKERVLMLQANGEGNNDGTNDNFSWNSHCICLFFQARINTVFLCCRPMARSTTTAQMTTAGIA
jgi:hypothetical protein